VSHHHLDENAIDAEKCKPLDMEREDGTTRISG